MRPLTYCVQSFWGSVRHCWVLLKGCIPTLPPASTSPCPRMLGEPQRAFRGIVDTALKQQGTKQQHPDSWSFLVKEQAGQRLWSRFLIPPALWARKRLYLQYKLTKCTPLRALVQCTSVTELRVQFKRYSSKQVFSWPEPSCIFGRIKYVALAFQSYSPGWRLTLLCGYNNCLPSQIGKFYMI